MSQKRKLLVVEDETSISVLLKQNLEFEGYEVQVCEDGKSGYECAKTEDPDLVILDLMLPEMSGIEVCKRLREEENPVPIIMLTAKSEQVDKIRGFRYGADDYITKPFDIMELVARVDAILRRYNGPKKSVSKLKLREGLKIDFDENIIIRNDEPIQLTHQEARLLKYFINNENSVLSREQIMEEVWGHDYLLSSRTIDTHVTHLRQKVEENPSKPKHIVTVHRVGYKFLK